MRTSFLLAALAAVAAVVSAAATVPGDAREGAELFKTQKCITCHSVGGEGGKLAPDLARRGSTAYTPSVMAALMWNHAPAMWSAMERAGIEKPKLSRDQAADLFAYFYAFRYFEDPGDAGRGKRLFSAKGCGGCHGITSAVLAAAPPVSDWQFLGDPIQLAGAMWNHASKMRDAAVQKRINLPRLTGQELTDILVYLQNLPGMTGKVERRFSPASPETGKTLYEVKGCSGCHQGSQALEGHLRSRTLADLAAGMWNHAAEMLQMPPELRPEEMTRLVGYLWSIQYFDDPGNPGRGKRVFESAKCGVCHGAAGSGAPSFASLPEKLDNLAVVSALWKHGPEMLEKMKAKNIKWPRFRNTELNDLIAYANSL